MEVAERGNLDLITIPDTTTYTYANGTGQSVINLTFSTPDITEQMRNWATDEDAHTGLDHEVIYFKVQSEEIDTVPEPTSRRYNWKKTQWEKFNEQLTTEAEETEEEWTRPIIHPTAENLAQAVEAFTGIIKNAADIHALPNNLFPRSKPCWTEDLITERRHMKNTVREFQRK